ncbi:hypothetical protein AYI70_g11384 [Smittium culicis]|uniref:Uncharacterized protein n=1 Tax=Smittium culicis TaxID=133412 RepID=A0A1R1X267_9FUNG|nr:hypothetical protein AYI70_g11384 [Smittium culicis]
MINEKKIYVPQVNIYRPSCIEPNTEIMNSKSIAPSLNQFKIVKIDESYITSQAIRHNPTSTNLGATNIADDNNTASTEPNSIYFDQSTTTIDDGYEMDSKFIVEKIETKVEEIQNVHKK